MQVVLVVLALFLTVAKSAKIVNTTLGLMKGTRQTVLDKKLDVYFGVPYAKPPVGDLRFKHPAPAEPWGEEIKDASTKKPICQQVPTRTPFQHLRNDVTALGEDCLHLSIWVPVTNGRRKLATMVYIYGGYFTSGSVNRPIYDGRYLAAENTVIVISINYRVGALGFLYMGNIDFPGNQGMMDQVLGLKWVYDNIESLGGHTKRITLFGESAGASCVGFHLLSPLSRNLFTRAILQSGSPSALWAYKDSNLSKSLATAFSSLAGCSADSVNSSSCIQQLPVSKILQVQQALNSDMTFSPVIDGHFLPEEPANLFKNVENATILLGVQKDEGSMFLTDALPNIFPRSDPLNITRQQFLSSVAALVHLLGAPDTLGDAIVAQYNTTESYVDITDDILGDCLFKCPVIKFADELSTSNRVFVYSFSHLLASAALPEWMGVPHSYSLEHVFGHALGGQLEVKQGEIDLTRKVMQYWTNFAKSGRPSLPERPTRRWRPYGTNKWYLTLDSRFRMARGLRVKQCLFWDQVFYPGT